MGRPVVTTVTLNAAVANGYAQSQSPGGAGNLTLNGSLVVNGVGTPDHPRRVGITSAGDDTGRIFTVYGTSRPETGGVAISEAVAGTNGGTAVPTQDFATVTRIAVDGATAGAVTAGTTSTGSGPWVPWDANVRTKFEVAAAVNVLAGAPSWTVEVTFDDVYGTNLPSGVTFPRAFPWASLSGKTGDTFDVIQNPGVRASRLTVTGVGSAQLTQSQQGD